MLNKTFYSVLIAYQTSDYYSDINNISNFVDYVRSATYMHCTQVESRTNKNYLGAVFKFQN